MRSPRSTGVRIQKVAQKEIPEFLIASTNTPNYRPPIKNSQEDKRTNFSLTDVVCV
jgi:hypothetical protein